MHRFISAILLSLPLSLASAQAGAGDAPQSVSYRGVVYVSLDALGKLIDGAHDVTPQARALPVMVDGKRWELINGGHRLKGPDDSEKFLEHPVLVMRAKHYVPLDECAEPFGIKRAPDAPLTLARGERTLTLAPVVIDPPFQKHRIASLKVTHESLVVTKRLELRRSLVGDRDSQVVPPRTSLLVRRRLLVDKRPFALVTIPSTLTTYLVDAGTLRASTRRLSREISAWARYRSWFDTEAAKTKALACGNGASLARKLVLTVDFCWSLHSYEEKLLKSIERAAKARPRGAHPVLFLSGRWIEQHPTEMQALVEMKLSTPRFDPIWANHSWVHPKNPPFMNAYSPETLRDDTLRVERSLLEWGLAPSVYYRFPGLVHDAVRLHSILDLDLFPIDSDAWMALVGKTNPNDATATLAFRLPAPGSIALVHGNGNETEGIPVLTKWMEEHPDWAFVSPAELFSAGFVSEPDCRDASP